MSRLSARLRVRGADRIGRHESCGLALADKTAKGQVHIPFKGGAGMAKTKSSYEEDYGEYDPDEDRIASTYRSVEAAEEAILRKVLGE